MRINYWSCSKLADRIRGTPKPGSATAKGWNEWKRSARIAHPIRWWIAEEGLDMLQDAVHWPMDKLYAIKYYINNRWVTRTHALTAHPRDVPRGQWCDLGDRVLLCLFNELQNFVEIDLAWHHLLWTAEDRSKYNAPWWAFGWFRWRTWRCPQAGLDNLAWQGSLTYQAEEVGSDHPQVGQPTPQAENAQEILALYKWWTEVYPNRPDPYDVSGWNEYCERSRAESDNPEYDFIEEPRNPETRKMGRDALDKIREIETAYAAEEEEMLLRLIKIRHSLST